MVLNYSKWDAIGDSDDDDAKTQPAAKPGPPKKSIDQQLLEAYNSDPSKIDELERTSGPRRDGEATETDGERKSRRPWPSRTSSSRCWATTSRPSPRRRQRQRAAARRAAAPEILMPDVFQRQPTADDRNLVVTVSLPGVAKGATKLDISESDIRLYAPAPPRGGRDREYRLNAKLARRVLSDQAKAKWKSRPSGRRDHPDARRALKAGGGQRAARAARRHAHVRRADGVPCRAVSPFGMGYGYGGYGYGGPNVGAIVGLSIIDSIAQEQRRSAYIRQQLETQRGSARPGGHRPAAKMLAAQDARIAELKQVEQK
ncbi:hypothetical protein JL720_6864 [Aureococcus anophagefferens]|nr:hypothetical protein JL720_6864 [Aureococcus anophagefferens]